MPNERDARDHQRENRKLDKELDDELEQTFPASDPPKITLTGSIRRRHAPGGRQARPQDRENGR